MNEDKWARNTPMFLSALVCPGVGQLAQKRWFAAVFFFLGSVLPAVVFIVATVRWLITNLQNVIDWNFTPADKTMVPYQVGKMALCFTVAMLFYFGGLIDTWAAQNRILKKSHASTPPPLP